MLSGDPIIDIAIAAVLTWAAYSSVAVVLLIMTLAAQQIIPGEPHWPSCWAPTWGM